MGEIDTATETSGTLESVYENRIGAARTDDEILGYWLFLAGVLAGVIGIVVFVVTDAQTTARGISYALAALAPPLIMVGAVIRFPLRRMAMWLATVGGVLALVSIIWFIVIFPGGWPRASGRMDIIGLYVAGVGLTGLAGAIIPLLTDPVYEEHATLTETTERQRADLDAAESRIDELEGDLAAKEDELAERDAERVARDAEIAALHTSSARFEIFEDAGGKYRWRLRHRNGNIIADSAQGYSSRQKCQQGMHSVMRNALGAGVLEIEPESAVEVTDDGVPVPADATEPNIAVPAVATELESSATFELFEDADEHWRWRLRHDNGNIIADSGEGYSTKSNAHRAMRSVREHVSASDYLEIDPAAFEIYRDRAGEYRWRLLHENGNILADSGQGYTRRSDALEGVQSVKSNIEDAEVEEQ